ncbi:MAG: hypothetical protein KGI98_15590 [Euryarchaeota archaeon]|nr:hypothetical protein [Euryarchaeota archaeon]
MERQGQGQEGILERLTRQLAARGVRDAKGLAQARLREYGILDEHGDLTAKGRERNAMTPAERAIDRAAKRSGRPRSDYVYHPSTNRATLRG